MNGSTVHQNKVPNRDGWELLQEFVPNLSTYGKKGLHTKVPNPPPKGEEGELG
jgi:hypothetical protein